MLLVRVWIWGGLLWGTFVAAQRDCGDTLGTLSGDAVRKAGKLFLEPLVSADRLEDTAEILYYTTVFDVQVVKLCSSCERLAESLFEEGREPVNLFYQSYCGPESYGYIAPLSGLAFLPLDPTTGELLHKTKLRTFVSLGTSGDKTVPTEAWPDNFGQFVDSVLLGQTDQHDFQFLMSEFLPALVAATSGSIGYLPDYHGYGRSTEWADRTVFWPQMYTQVAMVGWLHLAEYVRERTLGCTLVEKAVTLRGIEDGAFAIPFVMDAMRRFDIKILKAFMDAGPLDLQTFLVDTFQAYGTGSVSLAMRELLPSTTFTYSSDIDGVPNANTGDRMVTDTFASELLQWYRSPDPVPSTEIPLLVPADERDVVKPEFRELLQSGGPSPCQTSPDDALCHAILDASGYQLLFNESYALSFPFDICFSPEDEVFTANHYPEAMFDNDLVTKYEGPLGAPHLAPQGPHFKVRQYCSLQSMLFYNLEGHVPDAPVDRPNYFSRLNELEMEVCLNELASLDEVDSTPEDTTAGDPEGVQDTERSSGVLATETLVAMMLAIFSYVAW